MARFATGVTVLTAGDEHGHGMTANAFSSVSLDPPLVLCCVARAARMHEVITSAQSFAVSILAADQQEVARYFADWRRPRGRAQFDAVEWLRGPRTGAPLLAGSLAWLECELSTVYSGGDHSIFLGEVLSSSTGSDPDALLFFGGGFHQVAC
ncbi:flavin reductase family protein [Haloechinothrix sp. YIM 98757]|uniref:Flavin reductase family protein n=1 Tax=Haloechinothrix aidingensis TaxID=2752311 RepID=A0A838A289_9PSEU|nr:flavin reductase family protein [Haloechinothrix aidingensis]MBA0125303.1 flavin reductase family protein [Haloechinothrix aidingensis]